MPPVKGRSIVAEFMRRCDALDGRDDGVINNYQACRALFNTAGTGAKNPWTGKLCPGDVDPNPNDTSEAACLTSAQVKTLEFDLSRFVFPRPYENGVTSFGMWAPTTALAAGGGPPPPPPGAQPRPAGGPIMNFGGGGILVGQCYKRQAGAAPDAPMFTHLGILGAVGFVMQDLNANPLDLFEGGKYEARRLQISEWMDATNPDLSAFRKRGGNLLITIGTNDTVASSGAQLDYYQSVLDKMGRSTVDSFMRMWVIPQANHGLDARVYAIDGKGQKVEPREIPNQMDRVAVLRKWVEQGIAPAKVERLTGKDGTMPLCSYPDYPRYTAGDPNQSAAYTCTPP